ncbi:c6 transcription factor [Fusarium sporotrichioides]|uniref:C6 transcription factor n=1 Tax=Fusarium sporotrichioides TaxID=5514 RepID=A0A395S9M4_FUSSP|nr:c6 transcription factor [Fusarium sporotrichioides]
MSCLQQPPSRVTPRTSSPGAVRSRRSHTKSRHGCLGCKQRRKKCDEQRPQCSRCLDKDIPCEYPRSPKSRTLRSPVSDTESTRNQPQNLTVPSPHLDRFAGSSFGSTSSISSPFFAPTPNHDFNASIFTHASIAPSMDLGATELDLFSYYLSHTARSLAYDDEDLYALQVGFPNLAFRSKPLMSSILALAAVRKCHDILSQPETQHDDKGQVGTLLALADHHHRDSLRQTQADIPNADHYDHVVANAPLMVLYATANHAVRIKLSNTLQGQDTSTNLAPAQLHWMTLIRAAHLAYTGLLHSTKDFSLLDDCTASPSTITLSQLINGLVPMAENGPTQRTENLLMPIIAATYSSAFEKLQIKAQTLQFTMHLASSEMEKEDGELQACLAASESLGSILRELFESGGDSHDTSHLDLENDWAALSQLSDVSPWLRHYMARVTFSTPPKPLRRTIMWFLNRVPAEFLSIVQSTIDSIPDTVPDEGVQCDGEDSSETSRLAMDIFAHWLVLVMLLDGVWWIGGIGVCELGRITKRMGRQQEGSIGSKESWWPRSMLNIALEIGKQD